MIYPIKEDKMGLFGLFKKKKKEPEPEEAEDDEEKEGGDGGGAPGNVGAEISKIKAKIQSFDEMRKSTSERFGTINEQMGELRGQLMDTNKNLGTLEVKTTKAADLVESVHPDKLMIQVQKIDGKVEGLRGMIEAKDEMMKNMMDQMRKMRDQMALFKGVEQIINLNEEVKNEIMNAKKIVAMVERHADRVENIFIEAQKSFEAFNKFNDMLESHKGDIKELGTKLDKLEVKTNTFASKKDFDEKTGKIEKSQKAVKDLSDNIKKSYSKLDDRFEQLKGELKGGFDRRLYRAELLSKAFEDVLKDNPMFAKGLDLGKYIDERLKQEKDKPVEEKKEGKKDEKKDEKKEGEGSEGEEKKEGEEGAEETKEGEKKEAKDEKKDEKKEGTGEKFKKTYDDLVGDFVPVKKEA